MSEITNDPRLKQAAEEAIAKAVDRRVISFTLDGETYWIKRKMGNGRKQFAKYSVEKEFYFEVAKMTIAGRAAPLLVPELTAYKEIKPGQMMFSSLGKRGFM